MDGEGIEAMANERREIHLRPALIPQATCCGYRRHRQAGAYYSRSIVIPEVARNNQAAQKFTGQDAKVANFNW
jgi:hypothetical protein